MNTYEGTYRQFRVMINKLAWKFSQVYQMEFEEVQAQANLCFCRAWNSYDFNRSNLGSWIYLQVYYGLKNWHDDLEPKLPGITDDYPIIQRELEIESLSDDANEVIRLALEAKIKPVGRIPKTAILKEVQTKLKDLGWTLARIFESFEEITKALR